jgi:hypothetical protein
MPISSVGYKPTVSIGKTYEIQPRRNEEHEDCFPFFLRSLRFFVVDFSQETIWKI